MYERCEKEGRDCDSIKRETKLDIKKMMRLAYLPIVDAIVDNFYGIYEIYYEKLKGIPEVERDKLVNDAITATASYVKDAFSGIKIEDIMKHIDERRS